MKLHLLCGAALAVLCLTACKPTGPGGQPAATPQEAAKFMEAAEKELTDFSEYSARIQWVNANFITYDTEWLNARVGAEGTQLSVRLAKDAARFEGLQLDPALSRKLARLRSGIVMPAPSSGTEEENAKIATEKSGIETRMVSTYSTGKFPIAGKPQNLEQLSEVLTVSRDPAALKAAWEGWRTVTIGKQGGSGPTMAQDYARMVEIGNAGAKELGFTDIADMWLSNYDMPSADMAKEVDRLWGQLQPFYSELHCYVRGKLNTKYGDAVQPKTGPIRADLLGNMWAQDWSNIYDVVGPAASDPGYDLTKVLNQKKIDPVGMVKIGERFYTSLGLAPLPQTFWERSLITRPADREVTCHASAWDLDNLDDIRIKMCTMVNAEDFQTIHHELGHNFYQRAYKKQDLIFRDGANDGFHEAIGDFVALSITPEYLKEIGLIDRVPNAEADTGLLLNRALDKIAFLPFSLVVDKWRWQVFRGETAPAAYNADWWKLATQYQGIMPPSPRPGDAFDPGAKYHIPANTPYLRYFLSYVLQFQFHKAACEQAGWTGPLHRCSIYNNKAVGEKFNKMLEMGASKPWPDALEAFTGTRQFDASAMAAYFEPLNVWLKQQNQGQSCGW